MARNTATPLRIALVQRSADGLVQIAAVSDAAANLRLLESFGVHVDASMATGGTPHARAIVDALRRRFARGAIDGGPWFAADFFEVREALAEYDLASGNRIAAAAIRLEGDVYVEGVGEGVVTGFAGSRVQVAIKGRPLISLVTLAPASQVHPL